MKRENNRSTMLPRSLSWNDLDMTLGRFDGIQRRLFQTPDTLVVLLSFITVRAGLPRHMNGGLKSNKT